MKDTQQKWNINQLLLSICMSIVNLYFKYNLTLRSSANTRTVSEMFSLLLLQLIGLTIFSEYLIFCLKNVFKEQINFPIKQTHLFLLVDVLGLQLEEAFQVEAVELQDV